MFLARVMGSVVATQKIRSMTGQKLMLVEPMRAEVQGCALKPTGRTIVVVDTLGAGEGEMVLVVQGSSARLTPETSDLPVDAVVVGIVDRVCLGHEVAFRSGKDGIPREAST